MTVESTLPVQQEAVEVATVRPSSLETKPAATLSPPALRAPEAPTDAQVNNAHGHNVEELVKEMHAERAGWESHPVLASSPLWAGKLLARVHGSTIARLIAAMGNDPYLAYNHKAWAALDHVLRGNQPAADRILKESPELAARVRTLLDRLGADPKSVAAVLLRGHAGTPTTRQTNTKAPLQMLMDHVKEQPVPRRQELPQSARRVRLHHTSQTQRAIKPSIQGTTGRLVATLATPTPVKAYLIAQRAAYVALAHAQLNKDKAGKYRGPKQRRLIKKVKRKGDAHPRTRRDGSEEPERVQPV